MYCILIHFGHFRQYMYHETIQLLIDIIEFCADNTPCSGIASQAEALELILNFRDTHSIFLNIDREQ